ncbi:MAG: hypothetical protein WBL99_15120 [Candidatus Acidiferrales bacterium]
MPVLTNKKGRGGYSPVWTDEDTAYLRENYGTLSAREISAVLGRSETALHVRANILGLKSRHRTGINSLVPGYFSEIDTHMKAYLLGLLTADGFVTRRNQVSLALSGKDRELVELLRDEIAPGGRIGSYLTREKRPMATFRVQSPDLAADLAGHGVVPAKTLVTSWPSRLPYELENSYVCGYFDGDGSLIPTWLYRWTIVGGNPDFLITMQARIKAHTGINVGGLYRDRRTEHAYSICQTGEPVRALDAWVHRDMPGLARKRMRPPEQNVLF